MRRALVLLALLLIAVPAVAQRPSVNQQTANPQGTACTYGTSPVIGYNRPTALGATLLWYYCSQSSSTYQVLGSGVGDMLKSAYDLDNLGAAVLLHHATSCSSYGTPTNVDAAGGAGKTYLCYQDSNDSLYAWDKAADSWTAIAGGATDTTCVTPGVNCTFDSGDQLPWGLITGMPAGFADGSDADTNIATGLSPTGKSSVRRNTGNTAWEIYTPCASDQSCDLEATSTINSLNICRSDGTGCPTGVTDTTCDTGDQVCTFDDDTVDLGGSTITGGTASRCARFDGSGNLVAATGDCAAGDTGGASAQAIDADGDATNEVAVSGTTIQFDPDDDGAVEASISTSGTYAGYGANFGNHASQAGFLRLSELTGNGTNYIHLVAPDSIASNRTCTLADDTRMIPQTCLGYAGLPYWYMSSGSPGYYFDQTGGTNQDVLISVSGNDLTFQRYQTNDTIFAGYTFAKFNLTAASDSFVQGSTGGIGIGTSTIGVNELVLSRASQETSLYIDSNSNASWAAIDGTRATDGPVSYISFYNSGNLNSTISNRRAGAVNTGQLAIETCTTGSCGTRALFTEFALILQAGVGLTSNGDVDMNANDILDIGAVSAAGTITGGAFSATQHATDGQYLQLLEGVDDGSQYVQLKVPNGGLDLATNSGGSFSSGVCTYHQDGRIPDACVGDGTDDGGGGSGDVTDVGPGCATGACLTDGVVTTGTTMFVWEGTTDDTNELSIISPSADPGADINITLPSATGTLLTDASTSAGITTLTGTTLTLGDGGDFTTVTVDAGATDPVLTFGSNSLAITNASTFTAGGNAVLTAASTTGGLTTLTGTTLTLGDGGDFTALTFDGGATDPVLTAGNGTLTLTNAALDMGGTTSVEIPNGTGPTVDAAGEIAIDSDDDFVTFYGTAAQTIVPNTVRSMYWPAGSIVSDGTNCADPSESGNTQIPTYTIVCGDNDASIIYGQASMPDGWNGGTVTFTLAIHQVGSSTNGIELDFAAFCASSDEAVTAFGTPPTGEQAAAITLTADNDFLEGNTSAVTVAGTTCTGGDMLFWTGQVDATASHADIATAVEILGVKMEYTVNDDDN